MAGPGQLCGELAACGIRGANWANWVNYSFMDVSWMFHASLGDFESSFHRTICHSYLRWSMFDQGTSRKHRVVTMLSYVVTMLYRTKERKSQCCHIFIILHIFYLFSHIAIELVIDWDPGSHLLSLPVLTRVQLVESQLCWYTVKGRPGQEPKIMTHALL